MNNKPADRQKPASSEYSLFSNIGFVFSTIWKWNRYTVPLAFLGAIAQTASPFIAIFLPKMIIESLERGNSDPEQLIGIIITATLALLLANLGSYISEQLVYIGSNTNRLKYGVLCDTKTMSTDYANIEDPDGQTARQKAYESIRSNSSGGEAMPINLAKLLSHSLSLLLYIAVISGLNFGMIALMIGGSLLSFTAMRKAQDYEAAHRDEVAAASKKRLYVHDRANDYLNAKDIRLYDMSAWLSSLMDRFLGEMMQLRANNMKRYFAAGSLDTLIAALRDGIAYAYLIGLVLNGQLSVADFTLYFAAIAGISNWITLIATDMHLILQANREIGYLRSYLDIPDRSNTGSGRALSDNPRPEIVFDNVSFRYPGSEQWILRNFSLTIRSGEKLALVGMNGAGKTTCVKLMTGLYHPTEGRILVDGVDISEFNRDEFFRLFSAVFQEARILAMDLKRNVAVCPPDEIDVERVERSLHLAGLDDRLAEMPKGLDTNLTRVLDDEGIDLSGGQAQKLMLARALYKDAPIVIMDEPTAALDPLAEAELYGRYNEMVGHKTSLYISHRLASTKFCDRIAFIANGQISELGSHDELMALGGDYARMFEVQAYYYQNELKEELSHVGTNA